MTRGRSPWQGGRRAWERLNGWHDDKAVPGHPDDGDNALDALADVGLVRRLLDQAELVAVRTARRHGKSWAEIATRLGVTRQSAWERWRELDDPAPPEPAESSSRRERILGVAAAAAARRRASSVVVPNVVRLSWDDARQVLHNAGLVGVGPDPDGPPLATLGWPDGVVTDQSPEAGAKIPPGSPVTVWLERGGGSGVREPRRPKPDPRTGYERRDEPSDEAVG
jgi:hypothetical protein